MTDPDLIAEAAEILGWTICPGCARGYPNPEPHYDIKEKLILVKDFDPLNNIAHADLLRKKVGEMGAREQIHYHIALKLQFKDEGSPGSIFTWYGPRHITIAAVEAVKGERGCVSG